MTIKRVEILSFRHLNDLNFDLGKHLTVIAGGNGTGKTSLLGLIAHMFKYGSTQKTLLGNRFETRFSNVFRFSSTHDQNKSYKYKLIFNDNTSRDGELRTLNEIRGTRYKIDVGGRVRGGGKIKRPVIYLSLRRLLPLADEDEKRIQIGTKDLTTKQKDLYKEFYNRIFTTTDSITPVYTKSYYKSNFAPTSQLFDAHGISAGQDNIGQIILALLSFRALKESSEVEYSGGVLLIDEIDATLYPAAQKNLLKIILEQAKDLDLQIIFTTHSSDILNFLDSRNGSSFKHSTNFVSLTNSSGAVKSKQGFSELNSLLADLNHEALRSIKPKKINFYFEDSESCLFYKNIISNTDLGCEKIYKNLTLSCGTYKTLIQNGFEEFFRSIVVLDGDFKSSFPFNPSNNVVYLPGNERPENIVRSFLESLNEDDSFWSNEYQYTKRVFLQSIDGLPNTRESMKRWFNEQMKYWGHDCARLFERWIELNQIESNEIVERTKFIADRVINNFYELSTS